MIIASTVGATLLVVSCGGEDEPITEAATVVEDASHPPGFPPVPNPTRRAAMWSTGYVYSFTVPP